MCCLVLLSNFALLLTIQFASLFIYYFFFSATILSGVEFFISGGSLLGRIQGDREPVSLCIRCRGYQCSVNLRCEECENWSKEEMLVHEKILKSLTSKSIGRVNSSTKVVKKPASLPKTSADVDLDIGLRHYMVGCLKDG